MEKGEFTYLAFISYKREDEQWAKWLQKKLEHYKLPSQVLEQNPDIMLRQKAANCGLVEAKNKLSDTIN